MSTECEGYKHPDGKHPWPCSGAAVATVMLGCVHEHIFEASLCSTHLAAVESSAQCNRCSWRGAGEHAHSGCRLRILVPVGVSE